MQNLIHDDSMDADLVRRSKSGDRAALDDLIRRHQPWVLHIAQRMLWNRADAEDATQEIFVKAITHLGGFEQRSGFRTWLYRIAGNHLLDCCRSNKSFEGLAQALNQIPDADLPDPNSIRMETALLVAASVVRLPESAVRSGEQDQCMPL